MSNKYEWMAFNAIRAAYHNDVEKMDRLSIEDDNFPKEITKHLKRLRDESRALLIFQDLCPEEYVIRELENMQVTLAERFRFYEPLQEEWDIAFCAQILDLGKSIQRAKDLYQKALLTRPQSSDTGSELKRVLERRRVPGKDYKGYVIYPLSGPPNGIPVKPLPQAYLRFRSLPLEALEWSESEQDWKVRHLPNEEPFWEVSWPDGEILHGLCSADTAPYLPNSEPVRWKAYRSENMDRELPKELRNYYLNLIDSEE